MSDFVVLMAISSAIGLSYLGYRFGGDRNRELRIILPIVLWLPLFFAGSALYDKIKGPDCDSACQAQAEQFISDHPEWTEPAPTIDLNQIIEDSQSDSQP